MSDRLRRGRRFLTTTVLTSSLLLVGATGVALASDYDGDGYSTTGSPADCSDLDPNIHPGAIDKPDLGFRDLNCDGIDGDAAKAIFVDAGSGQDTPSAGSKDFPLKTLAVAMSRATAGTDVYVTARTYPEALTLKTGV